MITNISPQAALYAKLFPAPNPAVNVPGANLYDTTPVRTNYDSYSGRIDQAFGTHDFLFGRVSYINEPVTSSGGYPGVLNSIAIHGWNNVVHWSHVFGPTAILDLSFGRSVGNDQLAINFVNAPANFAGTLISGGFSDQFLSGFLAHPGDLIPIIGIAGYASSGGTGTNNTQSTQLSNTYQYAANFTKILSKHTLKFGGIFSTNNWIGPLAGASESTSPFQTSNLENPGGPSGKGTGDALASFLVGVPTSSQRRDENEAEFDGWVDGGYIQDQFKVRPRLTLNLGVRYDIAIWPYYGKLSDGSGYVGDMNLGNGTYVISAIPPACSLTRGAPCIPGGTLPTNVVVTRNSNHSIHNTDTGNWQPRVGIAYQPVTKTSIRAGYSRFYDEWSGVAETAQGVGGNWPSGGYLNIYSQNVNVPTANIADPLNLGSGAVFYPAATPFQNAAYYFNPSLKTPFTDQWNLGIDQEVGSNTTLSIVYAGSHTSRLTWAASPIQPSIPPRGTLLKWQAAGNIPT